MMIWRSSETSLSLSTCCRRDSVFDKFRQSVFFGFELALRLDFTFLLLVCDNISVDIWWIVFLGKLRLNLLGL